MNNKTKSLAVVLLGVFALGLTGCTRIEPGYVGIKVNQAGSGKGIEEYPIQTGWVWYFPPTTRVYEYPTFQQNVVWCASHTEGKAVDESISFNCKGGAAITADVSMSGRFVQAKVPTIFVKFRAEPDAIVHGYLRNEVRDALGRIAATYDPMEVIGDKRGEFLDKIKAEVKLRCGDWWEVDYITFANKLIVDPKIEAAINAIIAQKQSTMASELKVSQTRAEADQAAATAEGAKRVKIANAEGEAEATLKKAKAQAEAINLLGNALANNPTVIAWNAVQQWNGVSPQVVSGGGALSFLIGNLNTTAVFTNNPNLR